MIRGSEPDSAFFIHTGGLWPGTIWRNTATLPCLNLTGISSCRTDPNQGNSRALFNNCEAGSVAVEQTAHTVHCCQDGVQDNSVNER